MSDDSLNPYSSSHPWYYVLGGVILKPREIRGHVISSGYKGYMESEIEKAVNKPEPRRSAALRTLKERAHDNLFSDLSRYRQCVNQLSFHRIEHGNTQSECLDIHVNISLKYSHIFNDFAHLIWLEELLSEQPELFSFTNDPQQTGGSRGR